MNLSIALKDKRLGYAALDVFENEPNVPDELIHMSNVIVLPHVGSATFETRAAMGELTLNNLIEFKRNGKVLNEGRIAKFRKKYNINSILTVTMEKLNIYAYL